MPSSDHDFSRLAVGPRTAEQLGAAFTFPLTWPGVPAIYYGDEIGMRYVPGLPGKEGSTLGPEQERAGSRTPMQWDDTVNAGFSTAPAERLYPPVDPDPARPTVAAQRADETSVLSLVRRLIKLRAENPELGVDAGVEVLSADYPFAYVRGDRYLVVVNPRRRPAELELATGAARPVEVSGLSYADGKVSVAGFGHGVIDLRPSGSR